MHIKIASIMLIASVLALGALAPITYTSQTIVAQQEDLIQAISGGFESISVVQSPEQIIITITKTGGGNGGGEEPAPGDNVTVPTDPIIILPPNNETGQNGTVIVPEPLPPTTNETEVPGNVTEPEVPPVIIVEPPGNVTQVEPPSNVTVIDNGTVVIHPPDQNVTETPGNVTVVDPPVVEQPVGNTTEPAPCSCPEAPPAGGTLPIDETGSQPVQPPAATEPGDNTTIIVEPPVPAQLPVIPPEDGNGGNGDGGDGNNEDGNGGN